MSRKIPANDAARRKRKGCTAIPTKPKERQASSSLSFSTAKASIECVKLNWTNVVLLITFCLAAACATEIMFRATSQGIGVTTDSVTYISVARSLMNGNGFTLSAGTPLTHYPPLYPAALALSGILGSNLLEGAKWLHLIIYVLDVLLVGLLVFRGTRGSLMATAAGLLFVLTSAVFLHYHVMVLSEALFVFFSLAGLLFINEYLRRNHTVILVMAGIAIAMASLTRYVGFSLVGVLCLSILVLHNAKLRNRLITVISIVAISGAPLIVWFIRNRMVSHNLMNRPITYHSMSLAQIEGAFKTISSWCFIPPEYPSMFGLFVFVIIAALCCFVLIKLISQFGIHSNLVHIPLMCIIFLLIYGSALVFSVSFIEARLPFDNRMLLPFRVVLGIGLITLVRNAFHLRARSNGLAVLAIALCMVFLIAQGQRMVAAVRVYSENGVPMGFNNQAWKSSKAVKFIKALPDDSLVYSNGADAIDFLTGRTVGSLPRRYKSSSELENADMSEEMGDMLRRLENSQGYLVYFKMIGWRWYLADAEEVQQYAELRSVYEGWDGAIYQVVRLKN
jgi:hypothetical protein